MAICITFGMEEFTSRLKDYENVRAYCYNCQHWDAYCITRWPWFTICFIPAIPLSFHKYKEVTCARCRFTQDLRDRPDITPQTAPPPGYVYYPPMAPGAMGTMGPPGPPGPPVQAAASGAVSPPQPAAQKGYA
ncbi:rhodopsin family protein [Paecilomyces variotii No. 5]|uniref:Rhodopsin family protein n=1 Tax=Byssochlamys spectabilis (strain No. 5 / NBRC 109023) TaxID=1356009 RepID=V5F9I7_BYSSN|nr:rhodopsin family protein [Paecilomyces variotii No. 5]